MNDIERLAHASTALANHVAAVIRLSNVLTGLLKDGAREDLDPETRRVLLGAARDEHSQFRAEHFHGLISTINTVVEIADEMYQAEPAGPEAPDGSPDSEAVQTDEHAPAPESPAVALNPKEDPGAPSPA